MFPLTHIAMARQVLGRENRYSLLGSIFPDFALALGVSRDEAHGLGWEFLDFCRENYPRQEDFALGVLTHGLALPGLDYYADEAYGGRVKGFCFQRGAEIAPEVREVCCLPEEMALWKAHNFIEMSFEVLTAEAEPDIEERTNASFAGVENDECCELVAAYFGKTPDQAARMFQAVPRIFCFDGGDTEEMAAKYLGQLERRHGIVARDVAGAAALIEAGRDLVDQEYRPFMAEVAENLKAGLGRK